MGGADGVGLELPNCNSFLRCSDAAYGVYYNTIVAALYNKEETVA